MSTAGAPAGDGNYPVSKEYGGHALLSDHTAYFMSSFTPQFNWFLARGYQDNSFYREMNTRWLKADKLFWSNTLTDTSTIWGTPVRNRSWQLDKPTNLIVEILLYYIHGIISSPLMMQGGQPCKQQNCAQGGPPCASYFLRRADPPPKQQNCAQGGLPCASYLLRRAVRPPTS